MGGRGLGQWTGGGLRRACLFFYRGISVSSFCVGSGVDWKGGLSRCRSDEEEIPAYHKLCTVAVMILEPPAAPTTKYKLELSRCSTMTGEMEESGRLPGRTKLAGEGT